MEAITESKLAPQWLKPGLFSMFYGTTEVMPFPTSPHSGLDLL
jgi:hypothetical protein